MTSTFSTFVSSGLAAAGCWANAAVTETALKARYGGATEGFTIMRARGIDHLHNSPCQTDFNGKGRHE